MVGRVLLKIVYVLTCRILGLIVVLFRGDQAAVAEVLVLRHENAVLRRHAGRVRYEPADWPSLRDARAALVTGGLRVRGWTWSLSMLWVVAGIVGTGYDFYITTKPYTWATADVGIGLRAGAQILWPCSRRSAGNCRIVGSPYPSPDCRVHQAPQLAAAQLAPHSCVGRGMDRRLRAHLPGRGLGKLPSELSCDCR